MKTNVIVLHAKPDLPKEQFEALLGFVSKDREERIRHLRKHSYRNARNSLLGELLARAEICRVAGIDNGQLIFSSNEHGKPHIENVPNIHFNISHSGDYIAVAVDDRPVGIDIELLKPVEKKIAERFFAPDEIDYVCGAMSKNGAQDTAAAQSADTLYQKRFFEVWTKKESRIKKEGKGLSMPLPSFSVFDENEGVFYHGIKSLPELPGLGGNEAICHICNEKQEKPTTRRTPISNLIHTLTDKIPNS